MPRLLPAAVDLWVDRRGEMRVLDKARRRSGDGVPGVANVHGASGMGATALAVQWAWRAEAEFPDGQLYFDLRAGDGGVGRGAGLMPRVLRALGAPAGDIPERADAQVELYRTVVGDRKVLLVLDNVVSAAQVHPVVTAAPGVFVIAVSSATLTGLDAVRVPVGPLPVRDAQRLVRGLLGRRTYASARGDMADVMRDCAGSPWALRGYAAVRTDGRHGFPDAGGSLDADRLAAVLAAELPPCEARAYRLLALRDWPEIDAQLAAAALASTADEARETLEELHRRQLLDSAAEGVYRYRPTALRHGRDQAMRHETPQARASADGLVVAAVLERATRLAVAVMPKRWMLGELARRIKESDAVRPDSGAALADLEGQLGNVLEAARVAEERDDAESVALFYQAVWPVQLKLGLGDVLLPLARAATRSADTHLAGTSLAARAHVQRGMLHLAKGQTKDADEHLRASGEAALRAGHVLGQASAAECLGLLREQEWDWEEARSHHTRARRILEAADPGTLDAVDKQRALALVDRHLGRVVHGLGLWPDAESAFRSAAVVFHRIGDEYNLARTWTDHAEGLLMEGRIEEATVLLDRAAAILTTEGARPHLDYIRRLRRRYGTAEA